MVDEKKDTTTELDDITKEKKLLDAAYTYYIDKKPFEVISENTGVSVTDFEQFLTKNGYPHRFAADPADIRIRITTRLKKLATLRDNLEFKLQSQKRIDLSSAANIKSLGSLTEILFFPSWSKLIGTEFPGFYLDQLVYEVIQDSVVLLPDLILTGQEETIGEPFSLITGVGLYYVKFRLRPGEIISDFREITGVVLPLNVYEKAQDVSGSVINTKMMLMTEYLASIPFSLMFEDQTKQMYLRGVVARNVVHPNKECFDKLLEVCKDHTSLNQDDGLKILSGGLSTRVPLYANELLTEKDLGNYSKMTAGIKNVQPKLEKIISDLNIMRLKGSIFKKIEAIKKDYVRIGHPHLLDWIP